MLQLGSLESVGVKVLKKMNSFAMEKDAEEVVWGLTRYLGLRATSA